jgi:hypothetical protein
MICAKAERRLDSQGVTQEYKSRDLKVGYQEVKMGKISMIRPILYTTAILGSLS